jgi:predicted TIM-barrel fold metal-dependent hydrolase
LPPTGRCPARRAKESPVTSTPVEAVIEPELPICDPHHHLWHRHGQRYLLDELLADTGQADAQGARHNVCSTVHVECASMYRADGPPALRPLGETEFVNGIAAMSASGGFGPTRVAAGIVGFADLCLGSAVRDVLEAQMAAAGGRFRGIRHAAGWHASEQIRNSHSHPTQHLLRQPGFRQGFAQLAPLGLSFDAWLFHPQIAELTELAQAFGDTLIVLDHLGGPLGIGPYAGQAEAVFADWRRDIDALARCPNVVAKLGGLAMPINGFGWHKREPRPNSQQLADATRRYYLHAIDRFGPERCMFESNFPVDKVSCSYLVLWNSFKRLAAGFSAAEKAALFHDTAVRVYRLDA